MLDELFKYISISIAILVLFPLFLLLTVGIATLLGWTEIGGDLQTLPAFLCLAGSIALTHISVDKVKAWMGW